MSEFVEVDTAAGRVRGRWRETSGGRGAVRSAAFLGIPFAEPPVGDLRFAAPVPHAPWEGVRDALEFGATAQRGDQGDTLIPEPSVEGESTLNVNVFTPDPAASGLPVLVWIHGGGFTTGSPASPWYDGRSFNRDGVVTVTLSYRLGSRASDGSRMHRRTAVCATGCSRSSGCSRTSRPSAGIRGG